MTTHINLPPPQLFWPTVVVQMPGERVRTRWWSLKNYEVDEPHVTEVGTPGIGTNATLGFVQADHSFLEPGAASNLAIAHIVPTPPVLVPPTASTVSLAPSVIFEVDQRAHTVLQRHALAQTSRRPVPGRSAHDRRRW